MSVRRRVRDVYIARVCCMEIHDAAIRVRAELMRMSWASARHAEGTKAAADRQLTVAERGTRGDGRARTLAGVRSRNERFTHKTLMRTI